MMGPGLPAGSSGPGTPSARRDGAVSARLPYPLRDDYFGVDEFRLEDLLALAGDVAAGITYQGEDNLPAGTWSGFARSDEIFIIARLLAIQPALQRRKFQAALAALESIEPGPAGKESWWVALASLPTLRLAYRLDEAMLQLAPLHSRAAAQARQRIEEAVIKVMAPELAALRHWCAAEDEARTNVLWQNLQGPWQCSAPAKVLLTGSAATFLKRGFSAFLSAIQHLQSSLRADFLLSLRRADHDPAVGLLLASLQLRQKVQQRLNRFAAQHLDLYYERILRVAPEPIVPDRAIVLLQGSGIGREINLPAGTAFNGGFDGQRQERIYRSAADIQVTDARVVELQSYWMERSAVVSPENLLRSCGGGPDGDSYVTSVRLREIPLDDADDEALEGPRSAYAPFGQKEPTQQLRRGRFACLGIALASPVLAMKQGEREIRIAFEFAAEEGGPTLQGFVDNLAALLGTSTADAFFKAFRDAFRITITEESGWYEFPEYLPAHACVDGTMAESNTLRLSLKLPVDMRAVVPVTPRLHGQEYPAGVPVIRIEIKEGYVLLYSLLEEMRLARARIEVKVQGCKDVLVHNQTGRLSAASQFYPFGPSPVVGDYLVLGCEEAAGKTLSRFEVDIAWAGLPTASHGFADHYRGYPREYANEDFAVRQSVLADGHWMPTSEREQVETALFDTGRDVPGKQGGPVTRTRRIDLTHLCKTMRPSRTPGNGVFAYDHSSRNGFVRLTLSGPEGGFGQSAYPAALSVAALQNSKRSMLPLVDRFRKPIQVPMPSPPYTPLMDQLLVNYSAWDEIDLRYNHRGNVGASVGAFQIHPLGIQPLRSGRQEGICLVPSHEGDCHLFIGLEASELRGPLSLFFELNNDSRPTRDYQNANFRWHYLTRDAWAPLPSNRIRSDTTYGLLRSGIVSLDIPANASTENPVCPIGRYWLRISADWDDIANVSRLLTVRSHAVEVVWQQDDGSDGQHLSEGLPAGTIRETRARIAGLASVRQPLPSVGGKAVESRLDRITRTSERLRHRGRAVTARDYETLVLNEFPELYQVRCFPCCAGDPQAPFALAPGNLFLVVLPRLSDSSQETSGPMLDARQLDEISRFVSSLGSGVARIKVSNPAFEQIQVRCQVRLKRGQNPGEGLNAIHRRLMEHLSPWSRDGRLPAFDWKLRCVDVQAVLQALHPVSLATGISLLRISTLADGGKRLFDTARNQKEEVLPTLPWAVALPFTQHLIQVIDENASIPPRQAGIGNLAIGSTHIVTRDGDD